MGLLGGNQKSTKHRAIKQSLGCFTPTETVSVSNICCSVILPFATMQEAVSVQGLQVFGNSINAVTSLLLSWKDIWVGI